MVLPIRQGIRFDGNDRAQINFSSINLDNDFTIECELNSTNTLSSPFGCILSNNTANNRIMMRNDTFYVGVAGHSATSFTPPIDMYNQTIKAKIERISGKIYISINDFPTFEGTTQLGTVILNTIGLTSGVSFKFRGIVYHLRIKDNGTLVLEYKFDEGKGTTVFDRSSNNRNGTMIKNNWVIQTPKR